MMMRNQSRAERRSLPSERFIFSWWWQWWPLQIVSWDHWWWWWQLQIVTTDTNSKVTELSSVSAKIGSPAMTIIIIIMIMMIIVIIMKREAITSRNMVVEQEKAVVIRYMSPMMASWAESQSPIVLKSNCVFVWEYVGDPMQATLQHPGPGPGPPGQLWAPHLMVLVSGQQVNSRVGSPNAPWQKPSHAPTHLTALSISLLPTN